MRKVLIVDDEMFVRKGIVRETDWKSLGFSEVYEAENGQEALEIAREHAPDLIISDIRMPKMSGIEMLKVLRAEKNRVPVIFLTAYSEFEYAKDAVKLYASDYILKPFEDGELEEAVMRAMGEQKANGAPEREDPALGLISMDIAPGEKSRYIREALNYIASHYSEKELSVASVADSLGISEGHLSHLFKKETGCTVMAYITRYRMREAMKLLSDCRNKVYEAADRVGYRDITYFSSTFKKVTGMTPSEYQNKSNNA